jgi:hypothetical protein
MLALLRSLRFQLRLLSHVLVCVVMITLLEYGPNWWRRRILKHEYEGAALEARLQMKISGGWSMVRALYHMSSVNLRPSLAVGSPCPERGITLVRADGGAGSSGVAAAAEAVELRTLSRPGVPLLINFGSCS